MAVSTDLISAFEHLLHESERGDLVIPPEHESRLLEAMRRQLFFERQRCARLLWPLYWLQRDGLLVLLLVSLVFPIVALVLFVRPSWDEPWIIRYELERRWRHRVGARAESPYRAPPARSGSAHRPPVTHS